MSPFPQSTSTEKKNLVRFSWHFVPTDYKTVKLNLLQMKVQLNSYHVDSFPRVHCQNPLFNICIISEIYTVSQV